MVGAALILVVMFAVGPVAIMFGGAVWSAILGWLLSEDADVRAGIAATEG